MVNPDIIKAKIAHIKENVERLSEKREASLEEFKITRDLQDIVLHNLQLAIQGCIDIASHIISDEGWTIPGNLPGLFNILWEKKVITDETRKVMKSMVGFRNVIVHEYEDIDLDKVYQVLKERLRDFTVFINQVSQYTNL